MTIRQYRIKFNKYINKEKFITALKKNNNNKKLLQVGQ